MKLDNLLHIFSDRKYEIDFSIRDRESGASLNWSTFNNLELHFVVKENVDDADSAAIIHKDLTLGITLTTQNPVVGVITLLPADTANTKLPNGEYIWEIIHKSDDLGVVQIDFGTFQVSEANVKSLAALPAPA